MLDNFIWPPLVYYCMSEFMINQALVSGREFVTPHVWCSTLLNFSHSDKCTEFLKFFWSSSRYGIYRVIHKSLWDFRTRLRNNQDRHGRKEHINK